jgi:hypothetical protein
LLDGLLDVVEPAAVAADRHDRAVLGKFQGRRSANAEVGRR